MPKNRVLIITITGGMFVGKRVEPRTPAPSPRSSSGDLWSERLDRLERRSPKW
jgi:hypothetical protein